MRKKSLPILIFVICQLAAIAILVLWIVYHSLSPSHVWWLLQGILLMALVITGATFLFVFWTRLRLLDAERVNFISSISHELLTPLASMRLYIETMMLRKLDEEKRQYFLQLMLEDSESLENLISGILVSSRIERNKTNYHFERLNLAEYIEAFLETKKDIYKKASINLAMETDCHVMLDTPTFNAVVKNVIENAIKYSDGDPSINISLKKSSGKAKLKFTDKGEGVNPKELKNIFKIFQRANKTKEGTGLGLYIVKETVKAHKGKVRAQSEGIGKGFSIIIHLPLSEVKEKNGDE